MKTYPFILIVIKLYWLALLILIGGLAYPLKDALWPIENTEIANSINLPTSEKTMIAPELVAEIKLGKTLFRNNCGTCHNRNMKADMTGPALAGVKERWSDYPITDLYSWIRNAPKMVEEGHPKAVEVFNKYEKRQMSSFNNFSEDDVIAILAYVESVK